MRHEIRRGEVTCAEQLRLRALMLVSKHCLPIHIRTIGNANIKFSELTKIEQKEKITAFLLFRVTIQKPLKELERRIVSEEKLPLISSDAP